MRLRGSEAKRAKHENVIIFAFVGEFVSNLWAGISDCIVSTLKTSRVSSGDYNTMDNPDVATPRREIETKIANVDATHVRLRYVR